MFHMPGTRMVQSNTLSRRPDHIPENDNDNEDVVLLPDTLFVRVINNELQRIIETATATDDLVKNISDVLSKKGIPPIRSSLSDWKIEDGMLFYQERCYIPENHEIWKSIVKDIHESLMTGHPGRDSTLEMVQQYYWWP